MNPLVSVTIVTYNSRKYLAKCLNSVFRQTYRELEIILVDNASTDGAGEMLGGYESCARVIRNRRNLGFAIGQNQAIEASRGDWVLALNPDVRLEPDFLDRLVGSGTVDPRVGTVCGKLLRATRDLGRPPEPRIDSAGLYFTPSFRHFDRGWNEPDDGRYSQAEYVFGATGAAALYRRRMIDSARLADGFFDPAFFSYREDADVAWRAQLLGWRCLYVPEAVGHHVRRVIPNSRRNVPSRLRMHSVKNRFLMRIKNVTPDLYRRYWLPATFRDLLVVGGCLFTEPRSLPAFWRLARDFSRTLDRRRHIMRRRQATDDYIAAWFDNQAAGLPLPVRYANKLETVPEL